MHDESLEEIVADLAIIFHWTEEDCLQLTDVKLFRYHKLALDRLKAMNTPRKG